MEFFRAGRLDLLPIRHTLRAYTSEKFKADGKAALNVSLLDIPQGIAYAAIAELPIVFGIACSAAASIIAPLFAGSRRDPGANECDRRSCSSASSPWR